MALQSQGRTVRFIGTVMDITSRKRAERRFDLLSRWVQKLALMSLLFLSFFLTLRVDSMLYLLSLRVRACMMCGSRLW